MLSVHKVLFFSSFLFSLCSVWMAISRKKAKKKHGHKSHFLLVFLLICERKCVISSYCVWVHAAIEFVGKKIQVKYVQSAMRKYYVPVCPATDLKASSQCNHAVTLYLFTVFSAIQFWYDYFFSFYLFIRFFVTYILSKHFYHIFRWKVIWLKTTYTWSFRIYFDWLTMR